MLEQIAKQHSRWLKVVRHHIGQNSPYCEDIVQEMYLRVDAYSKPEKVIENGEVNAGYIFFILRNLCYDYLKSKKKAIKVGDDFLSSFEAKDNLEYEVAFGEFLESMESELKKLHWYNAEFFRLYIRGYKSGTSLRSLAKKTDIPYTSIHNTIKNVSDHLKEALSEQWKELSEIETL